MRLRLPLLTAVLAASAACFAEKIKVGQLGQALEASSIYASASSSSRVYYKVKPYEYIVVQASTRKGWTKVFMQDGRYGYMNSEHVAPLPYEVSVEAARAPATLASRSGSRSGAVVSSKTARALAGYSLNFVGTPYKWGGNDLQGGIDCSGFVKEVFEQAGVNLPRTAADQLKVGKAITRLEHLTVGDRLYFWDAKRNLVGHTGLYLGEGYFVHSSSNRGGVATDHLSNPKWRRLLVAARR